MPHLADIFETSPEVDVFEIISENYMVDGGVPLRTLDRILERYPVVMHGVSMSLAAAEPLDFDYLKRLKALVRRTDSPWVSDHLCWTTAHGQHLHDLFPVPYTLDVARYVAEKARIVQDYLEVPFALENLSSYVSFVDSTMSEQAFYAEVVDQAGVSMMLDVNNVYVSSRNHGFDPMTYLMALPLERVIQVHVAGHTEQDDGMILDTHDQPVRDEVWALYGHVHRETGGVATILEWDDHFLTFQETWAHAQQIVRVREQHVPLS